MWPGLGFARSGGETMPTLEPARPEDGPPGAGRHATAEAVLLRPLAVVGLVGAFHSSLRRWEGVPDREATARKMRRSTPVPRGAADGTVLQPSGERPLERGSQNFPGPCRSIRRRGKGGRRHRFSTSVDGAVDGIAAQEA